MTPKRMLARTRVMMWLMFSATVSSHANAQRGGDAIRAAAPVAPLWGTNVRLTPIHTIGALDGPPEYAFGELGEITVDRRGRLS